MNPNRLLHTILLTLALCAFSCSEEPESTSGPAGSEDLTAVPKSTDPVQSTSAQALGTLALTGLKLSDAAPSGGWASSHSRGMCETVSMVKDLISEASMPDSFLCRVGVMRKHGIFSASLDNGDYWYYNLGGSSGSVVPTRLRLVKSGGKVSQFEMSLCMGSSSASPVQIIHLSSTAANSTYSSESVFAMDMGTMSFGGRLLATGQVDSAGQWLSKSISAQKSYSSNGSVYGASVTLNQYADHLTLSGYSGGDYSSGSSLSSFSNSYYSVAEILNADSLSTLALGDGSANYSVDFSYDSNGDGDVLDLGEYHDVQSTVQSWNGDTYSPLANAADGPYHGSLAAAPTPGTVAVVSFETDEAWDCSSGTSTMHELDLSTVSSSVSADLAACDKYSFQNRNWINCSAIDQ